jgi:large subunit ribosomal protein L13
MATMSQKCFQARTGQVERHWHCLDATDQVLGRLAVRVATVLMGKHKPEYTPHVDTGDFVVIVNAEKVRLTGSKLQQKTYDRYTGYPSGRKTVTAQELMASHPDRVIRLAVRRMLPKNKLGRHMLAKLKIYRGPEHDHHAQQPRTMTL